MERVDAQRVFASFTSRSTKASLCRNTELVSVEAHKANTRRNPKHPQDDLQLELALEETTMKHK